MLKLKTWREIAYHYKQDKKSLDTETRIRIFELTELGRDDALEKSMSGPEDSRQRKGLVVELEPGEKLDDIVKK